MFRFVQIRLSAYHRMGSPAKRRAEEREDINYDPGTSGSEAGTPKKGQKKKETPDPGLTMGTDIEDHLKPNGRQVKVELDNVRMDQEKTKGSRGGPCHGTLRWTRTSEQAGKALRSQGHHCACVM